MIRKNKVLPVGRQGFTLIELLVVVAIIGILSSVVLASLNSARKKARDARRVADLKQIQLALEMYFDTKRAYPAILEDLTTDGYIPVVPKDPLGADYQYAGLVLGSESGCSLYHLGATLEVGVGGSLLETDVDDAGLGTICGGSKPNFSGTDPVYDIVP